jgi:hypothetical protein
MTAATILSRREQARRYRQEGPERGVYVIRNLLEPRVYLGASLNLRGAMNRARFELELGGHRHRALLADWQRLGADAFVFEVVQTLKKSDDPAFDASAELATLLELWRDEFRERGEAFY